MIEGLKPYPEYQDSAQEWLGVIPIHWSLKLGHSAFAKRKLSNIGLKENTVLSLSYGRIVVKSVEKQHGLVPASYETYQIVDEGDIIIRGTDLQNDRTSLRIGLSRNRGIISAAYLCLEPRQSVTPEYAYQILNTFDLTKAIYRYGSGLRQNLDHGEIKRLPIFLPPPEEQAAIVRFLDYANQKIDTFIRAKWKLIGLLNEQKQAIIHRAVTRGLNPDVPYKPSGIKCVGEIPKHWDVLRAKYLFREVDERSKTGNEEMLSVSHLTGVTPRSEKNITMFKAESNVGHKICRPGDLAINTMWAWMAALGFARHHGVISPAYGVYRQRTGERFEPEYADLLLRTEAYKTNYLMRSTGIRASRLRLYPEEFFKIPILVPPKNEQREIVEYLKKETKEIDESLSRVQSQIKLMQEYRTRLTADIVTGKLDVREAAKTLPEPTEERAMEVLTEDLEDEMLSEPEIEEINE